MSTSAPPIVHPAAYDHWPSATEYVFESSNVPSEVADTLDPWTRSLLPEDHDGRKRIVAARFDGVTADHLQPLRRVLLAAEPVSLVVLEDQWWVRLSPTAAVEDRAFAMYLPPPADPGDLDAGLDRVGFVGDADLREFLLAFGGLAEDFMVAGSLAGPPADFTTLGDSMPADILGEIVDFDECDLDEPVRSFVLYAARNGDQLVYSPDGRVAWFDHECGDVTAVAEGIEDFAVGFATYRTTFDWPFDSHGPPDYVVSGDGPGRPVAE